MGLKEILRKGVPHTVNLALKYVRAKDIWVEHVYRHFINIYTDKKLRYEATMIILGRNKPNKDFVFDSTIDWDNIHEYSYNYWKNVKNWVSFFTTNYLYIIQTHNSCVEKGMGDDKIVDIIKSKWLKSMLPTENDDEATARRKTIQANKLANYLIKCINHDNIYGIFS